MQTELGECMKKTEENRIDEKLKKYEKMESPRKVWFNSETYFKNIRWFSRQSGEIRPNSSTKNKNCITEQKVGGNRKFQTLCPRPGKCF